MQPMKVSDRSLDRTLLWFGVAAWGMTLVLAVLATALRVVSDQPALENRFGISDASLIAFAALAATYATMALLIAGRLPRNPVAWLMFGIGLATGVAALGVAVTFEWAGEPGAARLPLVAWLSSMGVHVSGVLTFVLVFAYPDRRPRSATGALAAVAWFALPFLGVSLIALHPGPIFMWPSIDNPFGFGPRLVEDMAGDQRLFPAMLAISWTSAAVLLVWRYRRSSGIERLQLKWFASAAIATVFALAANLAVALGGAGAGANPWPSLAYSAANALVPVSIGIAILRYHLYAIDRLINRVMVYTAVTATLAVVFALVVVVVGGAMAAITTENQTIAVAISTLVVASLFSPLRRRIQDAVDRRFDRARYDATQTVEAFAGRLRQTIDLEELEAETIDVVRRTLRPATAGVWLGRGR
jgi:hypothetical protein